VFSLIGRRRPNRLALWLSETSTAAPSPSGDRQSVLRVQSSSGRRPVSIAGSIAQRIIGERASWLTFQIGVCTTDRVFVTNGAACSKVRALAVSALLALATVSCYEGDSEDRGSGPAGSVASTSATGGGVGNQTTGGSGAGGAGEGGSGGAAGGAIGSGGAKEVDAIFDSADLSETAHLMRYYGVSVRLEGLEATDSFGRHAWEIEDISFLAETDVRFPPGSQSYLIDEDDGAEDLDAALIALNATNSRTHAPQFSDGHLDRDDVVRFSMGNEPPIHRKEFEPFGGYETWAEQMLEISPFRERSYIQTAQAGTILFMDPLSPAQAARWEAASAGWASGQLRGRGVASTEKTQDLEQSKLELLRMELDLYEATFPDAALWLTEWNAMGGDLMPGDDEMRLAVAEMLLAVARLDAERPGAIDALHYHQGWGRPPGSLLQLVDEEWVVSPAGEVYREFEALFRGRHVRSWTDERANGLVQAFVSSEGHRALAFVNKGAESFQVVGLDFPPRSYGVVYVP